MAEYIGCEEAKQIIDEIDTWSSGWRDYAKLQMDSLIATDVAPVVRCKDCKYYKTKYCTMDIWHDLVTIYKAKPDDYFSYGKRKED